jgi:hypothetical protein
MPATSSNSDHQEDAMRLTFMGKDPESNPTGSPTIYRTDRGSWIVQGWLVTDREALARMTIPDGETAVEIPDRMLQYFRQGDRDIDQ